LQKKTRKDKMKKECHILATLDLNKDSRKRIAAAGDGIHLTVIPTRDADKVPDERWAETDILYTWNVLPEPEKAPNLRWIQFGSAGVDPFLDHPLLGRDDLVATSMSGAITGQIAEYVLMALLAFGRRLPKLMRFQREHKWPEHNERWQGFTPIELRYSTVGILGYGSIGRQVARLLQPFGAQVLAAKHDIMHPEDTGYSAEGMGDPQGDFFHRLYPIEALHSLLAASDFVVAALPLTDETHHILDAAAFEAMRETAFLVNVGRGELVDQDALVTALKEGKLAGAALDVFEEEPLREDSPLWKMENVILSPHISGMGSHVEEETVSLFVANLNRYLADLPLYNQIDLQRGY
jgi:phosphoglycerate dehydrogenase-like enzyme